MLLAIFFIIGTSIFRGSLNYLIMNAIPSIGLVAGLLMSNSLLLIITLYGKVGYYPFISVLAMLFYNTSYLFILIDLINKRAYYSSSNLILNVSIYFRCSEYRLVSINLTIIIFSIRSIGSIKHIISISSNLLFILLYLLILLNNYISSTYILLFYIVLNSIILIKSNIVINYWTIALLKPSRENISPPLIKILSNPIFIFIYYSLPYSMLRELLIVSFILCALFLGLDNLGFSFFLFFFTFL